MPRVNLIVILMTYVRYHYSINCPTVICLPSMLLFILWRDTTSKLWTPVQFPLHCYTVYFYSHYLHLLAYYSLYHSIRSILCLRQIGEIGNLIVSWGKVLGCVVCRFHVVAGAQSKALDEAPYKLSGAVTKLASITFWSLAFSYWFNKPWFHNWGKTCCCAHHTFLLGFPTSCTYMPSVCIMTQAFMIDQKTLGPKI
jgi:hypothetical protein